VHAGKWRLYDSHLKLSDILESLAGILKFKIAYNPKLEYATGCDLCKRRHDDLSNSEICHYFFTTVLI
jgi:hypothetical protein